VSHSQHTPEPQDSHVYYQRGIIMRKLCKWPGSGDNDTRRFGQISQSMSIGRVSNDNARRLSIDVESLNLLDNRFEFAL
jgi:hypothetical protein